MADEANKAQEKQDRSLLNVSANATDLLGGGAATSKLFETVGGHLGQLLNGVGELINVLLLDRKRVQNEAYKIRELGDAQAYSTRAQAGEIARLMSAGQQVQKMSIEDGKVSAQLAGVSPEVLGLYQRSANQAAYDNILHHLNRERVVAHAAAELEGEQEVSGEPVNPDWATHYFKYAQDVSGEEMQVLWGRVLAGEVRRPGRFSPRTLQFLSLLTQKEAQLFQRACGFAWKDRGGYVHLILPPEDDENNLPPAFTYYEIQILTSIDLIEYEVTGQFSLTTQSALLSYNGSVVDVTDNKPGAKHILTGQCEFTPMGEEIASICTPEYDWCIMEEVMKFWVSKDYQVSCPFEVQPPKPADIVKPEASVATSKIARPGTLA